MTLLTPAAPCNLNKYGLWQILQLHQLTQLCLPPPAAMLKDLQARFGEARA
jgi:hypothetical protein